MQDRAGGMSTFSVTFTSGFEGDIAAGVNIMPSPGSPVQLTLTGRGIDRHIQMIDSLLSPDTYRNPGSKAPTMPVPISNSRRVSAVGDRDRARGHG